jgi:hypothetical protein
MIARGQTFNVTSHTFDNAARLVTENHCIGIVLLNPNVRMADAASGGFDQHLVGARFLKVEFFDDQLSISSKMHSGLNFHDFTNLGGFPSNTSANGRTFPSLKISQPRDMIKLHF